MVDTGARLVFEKLEETEDGLTVREEYQLPIELSMSEMEEIDELRRLSLALREPQIHYDTTT